MDVIVSTAVDGTTDQELPDVANVITGSPLDMRGMIIILVSDESPVGVVGGGRKVEVNRRSGEEQQLRGRAYKDRCNG